MKLLINLAQIDGTVADREKNFIINIGRANGVYPDELSPLFDKRNALVVPGNLTADEKFKYILSLVQLMKIDERMYKEEILFCTKIASNLGYGRAVMSDLLLHVSGSIMSESDVATLKIRIQKHLNV